GERWDDIPEFRDDSRGRCFSSPNAITTNRAQLILFQIVNRESSNCAENLPKPKKLPQNCGPFAPRPRPATRIGHPSRLWLGHAHGVEGFGERILGQDALLAAELADGLARRE